MCYWHHCFKMRIYRFGIAGLNINESNMQTILLFTKQLLLVFNVRKNNIACYIPTFVCNISNLIKTNLSKFYVMTKQHFPLLPINQTRYGKTKCIFEFSTTKLVKPNYFGFYRRKKGFFLQPINSSFTQIGT
jgi:hypothetical protein